LSTAVIDEIVPATLPFNFPAKQYNQKRFTNCLFVKTANEILFGVPGCFQSVFLIAYQVVPDEQVSPLSPSPPHGKLQPGQYV